MRDKLFRREVGGKSEFGFDTEQPKVASVANRMFEFFDSYSPLKRQSGWILAFVGMTVCFARIPYQVGILWENSGKQPES